MDPSAVVGRIFDIQRFCIHDGPGIRTTVFFKGCPLACAWCHNPESQSADRELFYTRALCIGCGACSAACPEHVHLIVDGSHSMDRSACIRCFRCVEVCPTAALEAVGREVTVDEVLAEVERDRVFYEQSGGGMTLSGGEPLAQSAFARALLEAAHRSGLHTCVETSGFGAVESVLELAQQTDLLLWDLKDTDEGRHRRFTGAPLAPILANLSAVDAAGHSTVLRCILLETINLTEDHLEGVAAVWASLRHCIGVELLPYHALGRAKLDRLGYTITTGSSCVDAWTPSPDRIDWVKGYLSDRGVRVVDEA